MDSHSILSLVQLLLVFILLMAGVNMYLVFRLREIDPFEKWDANKLNGTLFLVFFIVGMTAALWASSSYYDMYSLVTNAASVHGEHLDVLFWITMSVVMFVFVVVNAVLFFFAYKYRGRGQKATFYPHNNKLELIWTIVPAVVLSGLIFYSVGVWHEMMGDAPKDALHIELYGKQFDWTIRYAGSDKQLGESHFTLIDDGIGNTVGMNLEDPKSHDDFYITDTIVLPVNKPVKFRIVARDVLHSATMMHFRMKMDAVPGMPTSFWFTPKYTTVEMRKKKNNPEFVYEMSCQQICGGGHWNMRRVVKVVEQAEYNAWFAKQKSFYATLQEQNAPAPADTTKSAAPAEDAAKKNVAQAAKASGKIAMK